jgi:hypothetical protein
MHDRYVVDHEFLSAKIGTEATTIAQTVNAFFRWEFNSCEMLVQGDTVIPIDYANACPDVAVTSLHYYFPWAMKSLIKWTAFCAATGRLAKLHVDSEQWFAIADDQDLDYEAKLVRYQELADEHFEKERYLDFCAAALPDIDDLVLEWVSSADFDRMLLETITQTYPEHERERFIGHFRGLVGMWVSDQKQVTV